LREPAERAPVCCIVTAARVSSVAVYAVVAREAAEPVLSLSRWRAAARHC